MAIRTDRREVRFRINDMIRSGIRELLEVVHFDELRSKFSIRFFEVEVADAAAISMGLKASLSRG